MLEEARMRVFDGPQRLCYTEGDVDGQSNIGSYAPSGVPAHFPRLAERPAAQVGRFAFWRQRDA